MVKEFNTPEDFEQYALYERTTRVAALIKGHFPGMENLLAEANKQMKVRGIQIKDPSPAVQKKQEMVIRETNLPQGGANQVSVNETASRLLNF